MRELAAYCVRFGGGKRPAEVHARATAAYQKAYRRAERALGDGRRLVSTSEVAEVTPKAAGKAAYRRVVDDFKRKVRDVKEGRP